MESFFSRYKNVLVLIVVLLVQVVGLAVQVRRPVTGAPEAAQIRLIRYWMVSLVAPPERLVHAIGGGFRGMWSNYVGLRGVRQQNRDLKAEVERLRMEQAGLVEDARQENACSNCLNLKGITSIRPSLPRLSEPRVLTWRTFCILIKARATASSRICR